MQNGWSSFRATRWMCDDRCFIIRLAHSRIHPTCDSQRRELHQDGAAIERNAACKQVAKAQVNGRRGRDADVVADAQEPGWRRGA
jgi:hypothetical protein